MILYLFGSVPIIVPPVYGHWSGDPTQVVQGRHLVIMVLSILGIIKPVIALEFS